MYVFVTRPVVVKTGETETVRAISSMPSALPPFFNVLLSRNFSSSLAAFLKCPVRLGFLPVLFPFGGGGIIPRYCFDFFNISLTNSSFQLVIALISKDSQVSKFNHAFVFLHPASLLIIISSWHNIIHGNRTIPVPLSLRIKLLQIFLMFYCHFLTSLLLPTK